MASGAGERTESNKELEEPLPQITPDKGKSKRHMRGTAKTSKPPLLPQESLGFPKDEG